MSTSTDRVIPNDLAIKSRAAKDDMQAAALSDFVLRKIILQTPADSELGRALALVRDRVHQFNREADAAWRKAEQEIDAHHQTDVRNSRTYNAM